MTQVLPLFDAPDDAELRAQLRERIRVEPVTLLAFATLIAQTGRLPSRPATAAVLEEVESLASAAPDRVRDELTAMLIARDVHLALQWLHEVGALSRLLPELEATVDFSQE